MNKEITARKGRNIVCCAICGREIRNEADEFTYKDAQGVVRAIYDCCRNGQCIVAYADQYGDAEPREDVEAIWENQQDDLWEMDVISGVN